MNTSVSTQVDMQLLEFRSNRLPEARKKFRYTQVHLKLPVCVCVYLLYILNMYSLYCSGQGHQVILIKSMLCNKVEHCQTDAFQISISTALQGF